MIAFHGFVLTEIAQKGRILQIMMIRVRNGKVTEKQKRELQKARMDEFMSNDEAEIRKMYSDFEKHIRIAQEEMGLSKVEALYFVATLFGNAIRPGR